MMSALCGRTHEPKGTEGHRTAAARTVWRRIPKGARRRQVAELHSFPIVYGRYRVRLQNVRDAPRLVAGRPLRGLPRHTCGCHWRVALRHGHAEQVRVHRVLERRAYVKWHVLHKRTAVRRQLA